MKIGIANCFAFFGDIRSCRAVSMFLLFLVVCSFNRPSVLNADDGFTENAQAAIEQAVKEKKDLLFLFTGSDWCPPCKKLESEVLEEEDFIFEVTKHFVLVKFDFPQTIQQSAKLQEQNKQFAEKFGVDGYPTIVLADNKLKPFAFAGYETGGFQNYLALLEKARQLRINRDEKLAMAEGKTGEERAKLLDQAISEIRSEIVNVYYPEIIAEIVEIDKDNRLGLREKWNGAADAEMRKIVMTDMLMISRVEKPQRAISFIDEVLAEIGFTSEEKLKIYQIKLNLVRQLKDDAKLDALLDEMIELPGVVGETKARLIVKKVLLMVGSKRTEQAMALIDDAIKQGQGTNFLYLAKGQLLDSMDKHAGAIEAYDMALKSARTNPDLMIDVVSAKADALFASDDAQGALQALDSFADDTQMPADLRAEALIHKAMMMRDMKRVRQARLAENRAIEVAESAKDRASIQKIVDRLRAKASR